MIEHKKIDIICIGAAVSAALITLLLILGCNFGIINISDDSEYINRLFDDSRVHAININIDNWDDFIADAEKEEYVTCDIQIDGEEFYNVGLRTKGNNSLSLTEEYGLSRYSLKIEFDRFIKGGNYYGLDKFSLDASFQDNSYLKTYMAYDMMRFMDIPTPLASYTNVSINGVDWGLFLAIEEPEESFARRNFGSNHGKIYKPDYRSLKDENADIALKYIDEDIENYPGIFENAKLLTSDADKKRVIEALKTLSLSEGANLKSAVNVDEVIRYFTVQVFVMNWDSYLGHTSHNYLLYEEDGILSILPWDYNLAFGTYALGMTDPIKDPNIILNYPINTPAEGSIMLNRPLYHNLMKNNEYFGLYHEYFNKLISEYFESGRFETVLRKTQKMIDPFVRVDPTAFCSYEDHLIAVDTLEQICLLRAKSIRGQLDGDIPATLKLQHEYPESRIDASTIDIADLGDFEDLKSARRRQNTALEKVINGARQN